MLIIGGVREDGKREILAVEVADTEREATDQKQFRPLKARGLTAVELLHQRRALRPGRRNEAPLPTEPATSSPRFTSPRISSAW